MPKNKLRARVDSRRHHRDARHFATNRFQVFNRQRVGAGVAGAAANAAHVLRACADEQQIRADAGNLRLHRSLRSLANADHGDHRGHADDDAEHGQRRAHLVANQRAKSNSNDH